ncbi:MAG: cytochrome c5 family protein [endosymbiont of Galathealinum brachiosum]|uniref:Cytochrome c5 family protein n=1 Tax=endosymbiont of Galathealinum brachiosum TaxID=2200906 RepID=A0A370D9Z1_9GAMM|nr:MAG: cytochrome c5 family protein [endosymbiont of Galathealinum brachiosum]
MVLLVGCDSGQDNESTAAKVEPLIKTTPTAVEEEVVVTPKAEVVKAEPEISMNGEQVYNKSCVSCHASGAAGAPKLGDTTAWKTRIEKGVESLYSSAINGVPGTAMMVKGTCAVCSDEELKAAVDYMVAKIN